MLLLACTILADKSHIYIDIKYLNLVRDLTTVGIVSWASTALAFLYGYLGDASLHDIKQIGGYMTLLQVRSLFL